MTQTSTAVVVVDIQEGHNHEDVERIMSNLRILSKGTKEDIHWTFFAYKPSRRDCNVHPALLEMVPNSKVLVKQLFSVLSNREFIKYIRLNNIGRIIISGFSLRDCVLISIRDIIDNYSDIEIITSPDLLTDYPAEREINRVNAEYDDGYKGFLEKTYFPEYKRLTTFVSNTQHILDIINNG